jgi:NADPH2:quinone reductase
MRAVQITELSGPRSGLSLVDLPEPEPSHMLTPGSGVVVDVHAAGVSFPEVLQSRGEYQLKPPLPFVPGSEVGGVVRSAPEGAGVSEGDRVAAFCMLGGFAEVAVAPEFLVFRLPDALDFAQGAGLVLNYHTAYFALKLRGRLAEGESVLVHGAAGGVGTAALQVAKGLGARTLAVVSSDDKVQVAREAGADEVVRSDGPWKDQAKEWSDGGVDVVLDPVGGEVFERSLRVVNPLGVVVALGFAGGWWKPLDPAPLVGRNVGVLGFYLGRLMRHRPDVVRAAIGELIELWSSGAVRPLVGATFPLASAGEAQRLVEERRSIGKVVLIP